MHVSWQDVVLAACILGFNLALLPTLMSRHKPQPGTGVMTAFFQIVGFVVYVSLALWYSAAMALLNAVLWGIIVFQKLSQKPTSRRRRQKP